MYLDRNDDIGAFFPHKDDELIVCRCEEITKGEIRQAIHEGMRTMTEVKRFLRAGMGLCQGKTCGRIIKGIIAQELGVGASNVAECTARGPARPAEIKVLGNEAKDS
jgi:NAD(P)H-nitrite reductase